MANRTNDDWHPVLVDGTGRMFIITNATDVAMEGAEPERQFLKVGSMKGDTLVPYEPKEKSNG